MNRWFPCLITICAELVVVMVYCILVLFLLFNQILKDVYEGEFGKFLDLLQVNSGKMLQSILLAIVRKATCVHINNMSTG